MTKMERDILGKADAWGCLSTEGGQTKWCSKAVRVGDVVPTNQLDIDRRFLAQRPSRAQR